MGGAELGVQIIGREQELARLFDFLEADHFRALILTGGPGIGKTTLWEAGIEAARERGVRVLSARPSEAEARLSLAALADLLEQVGAEVLATLPAPRRHALEVALLRAEPVGLSSEPRAIGAGFLHVLRELASRAPLVVAVDDVHWLDAPSANALVFAARRLQGEPIGFLLSARSETPSPLAWALEPKGLTRIDVEGLSLGGARRLLSQRLGLSLPRRAMRRIFESTRGNPLFLLELGRTLAERGPPDPGEDILVPDRIEDLLGVRVARLSRSVRKVLLAVALSADLRMSQLAAVADLTAIDEALDARLVFVDGERVRPAHPLLAAAVRSFSRAGERKALHLDLARAVDGEELRARHLALATRLPDGELAKTVADAAAVAALRGATEDAVELAEHALRLTPSESVERTHRLLALAEHLLVADERKRATDLLAPEIDRLPAGSARARAHLLLADSRFPVAHVDEYGDHLERALAESEGDPALRATVMARKARYTAVVRVERIREAEAWAHEALPAAHVAGPEVERDVLHGLGWARALRGQAIDDLCELFRMVSPDAFGIFRSLDRLVPERLAWRGDVNQARTIYRRLLNLSDERGEELSYFALRVQLCEAELRAGQWESAAQVLDEWEQSPDRELHWAGYQRCRGLLAIGRGLPDEAERWAAGAIAASEASGLCWNLLEGLRARGIAALLVHEPRRAADSLRSVWEHTQREGVEDPGVFPVAPDLVEALAEIGEVDEALAVTTRLRKLAAEQEHPWGLATGKRCRALVQFASGVDEGDAASALMEAAADYAQLGLRFDRARSLLLLGRAERRLKRWGGARRSLEQAAAAFDELGSPGWAEQARAELARIGARRPGSAGELTPTEQRVVELATDGLSNKEIAHTLFVSVHTVEVHLAHAYAKLGVHSRAQLARRLSVRE